MAERVLVVGNGFIGFNAVPSLSGTGFDTAVPTRSRSPDSEGRVSDAQVIIADASDHRAVDGALPRNASRDLPRWWVVPGTVEPGAVRDIHLALRPLLTIPGALRQHPESGSHSFRPGDHLRTHSQHLVVESDPTNPVTSYGLSKLPPRSTSRRINNFTESNRTSCGALTSTRGAAPGPRSGCGRGVSTPPSIERALEHFRRRNGSTGLSICQ